MSTAPKSIAIIESFAAPSLVKTLLRVVLIIVKIAPSAKIEGYSTAKGKIVSVAPSARRIFLMKISITKVAITPMAKLEYNAVEATWFACFRSPAPKSREM